MAKSEMCFEVRVLDRKLVIHMPLRAIFGHFLTFGRFHIPFIHTFRSAKNYARKFLKTPFDLLGSPLSRNTTHEIFLKILTAS